MLTMKASEFKAKCLALMDQVNETGDEIIITKNGKPVSVLRAYKKIPKTLFGRSKGKIKMMDDLIEPVGEKWDAE